MLSDQLKEQLRRFKTDKELKKEIIPTVVYIKAMKVIMKKGRS